MKLFPLVLIITFLITSLCSTHAVADGALPRQQEAVRTLFGQVMSTMNALHAPLGFSVAQLHELLASAQTLIDPVTDKTFETQHGHPMIYYVIDPDSSRPVEVTRSVLFIGGIHADEISPMYSSFHTLYELLTNSHVRPPNTRVVYIPLANPEGLIDATKKYGTSTRRNSHGVDLNRGFQESPNHTEPEVAFIKELIAKYNPTHIVSLHAPFGWLDYDGPGKLANATSEDKRQAKAWIESISAAGRKHLYYKEQFENYHGSMGNYGGNALHRNVMTIEYPAGNGYQDEEQFADYGGSILQALDPPTATVQPLIPVSSP